MKHKVQDDLPICCICGKVIFGWGNNPWPIVDDDKSVCCDTCNAAKVVPARIQKLLERGEKNG